MNELAKLLPRFDFSERHAFSVTASPGRVYGAARELRVEQVPVLRLLMAVRSIPASFTGRSRPLSPSGTLLDEALGLGFRLGWEETRRGVALVGIGRYWQLDGGVRPISDVEEFLAFTEGGFAKAAIGVLAERRDPSGSTWIVTETRILATDAVARQRFGAYWRIIRPASGAIRRAFLRAVALAAEREPRAPDR